MKLPLIRTILKKPEACPTPENPDLCDPCAAQKPKAIRCNTLPLFVEADEYGPPEDKCCCPGECIGPMSDNAWCDAACAYEIMFNITGGPFPFMMNGIWLGLTPVFDNAQGGCYWGGFHEDSQEIDCMGQLPVHDPNYLPFPTRQTQSHETICYTLLCHEFCGRNAYYLGIHCGRIYCCEVDDVCYFYHETGGTGQSPGQCTTCHPQYNNNFGTNGWGSNCNTGGYAMTDVCGDPEPDTYDLVPYRFSVPGNPACCAPEPAMEGTFTIRKLDPECIRENCKDEVYPPCAGGTV